jgi:branched-chain amino acid aminotransferase
MRIEFKEARMSVFDVYTAQECFLTGTAAEIVPVVELDGRKIGEGKPGKLTSELEQRFRILTQTEGVIV